ncbi:MAG: STAS domain-containing protein [Magnetococcales bacterium]|nr:STAS domain-containing protein [Magnetococcales bacterium]
MSFRVFKDGDRIIVQLPAVFGFGLRNEFRKVTADNPVGSRYELDFQLVEKMDSAAMGMLLLLKEVAGGDGANVVLTNVKPEVIKLLQLVNFHKLFTIR